MLSLADAQSEFRAALTSPVENPPSMLTAPVPVAGRLEIYRRHHRSALSRHIRGRYPTVEWLLGGRRMSMIAETFVAMQPPTAPCMAEYGSGFIATLIAQCDDADIPPYLPDVARLDWLLGEATVSISHPPVEISSLASIPPAQLPDVQVRLQPGAYYLAADWPVDNLVRVRLSEQPPGSLAFAAQAVSLEVFGSRGQFRIAELDPATFGFRAALSEGDTLGFAVERAMLASPTFDVAHALAALFADGLVIEPILPLDE